MEIHVHKNDHAGTFEPCYHEMLTRDKH